MSAAAARQSVRLHCAKANSNGRYIGALYGGWKQSGLGEEECFDGILNYTQLKKINMRW
ncbi:MAG TPA: hypothetical protein VMF12_13685 [Xanthobacteraceae bacterium]|nr:hypothetical protein [Xanthobacteraceae bacterium]